MPRAGKYAERKRYDKLVRDKIPDYIRKKGSEPLYHVADEQEYRKKLYEKLGEEVGEFSEDSSTEELADILEILYAIRDYKGISPEEFEEIRKKKADERGAFVKRIILDES